ncbi:MAG: aldo/keto reductase [Lachnospiraceae bacterium]|nr:aldo/keto reductase [Ruminococcus sp.]MCM1276577.1 aldo/keto reductase [Lachnospiraceae bacterium]
MKKLSAWLLGLVMSLGLTACGTSGTQSGSTQSSTPQSQPNSGAAQNNSAPSGKTPSDSSDGGKALVVYYSATNNTEKVAEYIAEETGGDLFELVPTEPYSSADLDWTDRSSRVSKEHDDASLRAVELEKAVSDNWESYDYVFVGYPIWWGIAAWPVDGFISANDFSGKTVIPFCTSTSSGLGESGELLAEAAGTGNWLEGERFRSSAYEETVKDWVKSLGLVFGQGNTGNSAAVNENVGVFDFETRTVLLNDGNEMPILGIGTFTLSDDQASDSVYWALSEGYHLIDTAKAYNNEVGVGRGIKRAIDDGIVKREDIFVTTKLWPDSYNTDGIDAALENLGLEYIDLLLLHQPMGNYIGGYQAMEQAVKDGKVRSIGVSNFTPEQFKEIMAIAEITPAVNQIETHPYYQESEQLEFLKGYGTVLESWFPLGGRGHTQELFADETVSSIAEVHGKSSAQVILRWHLQAGHIAIPGSNNPDHIKENISIFDFELTDEEMERMAALETGVPFFGGMSSGWGDAADRWGLNIGDWSGEE